MYGKRDLAKVVRELDVIHERRHQGKFDTKIVKIKASSEKRSRKRFKSKDAEDTTLRRKKETLVL